MAGVDLSTSDGSIPTSNIGLVCAACINSGKPTGATLPRWKSQWCDAEPCDCLIEPFADPCMNCK